MCSHAGKSQHEVSRRTSAEAMPAPIRGCADPPRWVCEGPHAVTLSPLRRAKLYRKAGRNKDAERIEADLLKRLAYADPDYSILVELKRSRELAAAQSLQ